MKGFKVGELTMNVGAEEGRSSLVGFSRTISITALLQRHEEAPQPVVFASFLANAGTCVRLSGLTGRC